MNAPTAKIEVVLAPDQIEQLAQRVAELVKSRAPEPLSTLPDLLSITEAADVLAVSPRTVTRMIASGRLVAKKNGRVVRIPRGELMHWLSEGQ